MTLASRDVKFKAQLSHEGRDYFLEDESTGDARKDQRLRLRIGADWEVFKHFSLAAYVERTDIRSNLESAALNKTIVGAALNANF